MEPNIPKPRKQTEEIRQFILEEISRHPTDITVLVIQKFEISRQAINRHLQDLVQQNLLAVSGSTRSKRYELKVNLLFSKTYALDGLEEDKVWRTDIAPKLIPLNLARNAYDIWHYGFTEMLNNAIDHSNGTEVRITLGATAINAQILIVDNGEGIFQKISRLIHLDDERHAILELAKGKLTTAPERHSGEGIFFSSRMFDNFTITSGNVMFSHEFNALEDWILPAEQPINGTLVSLILNHHTKRTSKEIFDSYTSGDDYGFVKTVIPVYLAQYDNETLISRSQARRVLARVERFKVVIFDFAGVDSIGQAFADEIFRVFKNQKPEITLAHVNTNKEIEAMITRALKYN